MTTDSDAVDLREVVGALRRGIRWIAAGALLGLIVAAVLTFVLPPQYEGRATILLRTSSQGAASALGGSSNDGGISLGGLADVLSMGSGFDTELEILTSRTVIAEVIDSLGLRVRVLEPRRFASRSLFSAIRLPPGWSDKEVRFERQGTQYRVTGSGISGDAVPGVPFRLGEDAALTLQQGELPEEFRVELLSLEKATERIEGDLDSDQAGGDIAELVYSADDPITAAAVPNLMITEYLARRKTTDRGINQYRYEFLEDHTDSISTALATAESRLRQYQQQSGVMDPQFVGETELEQAVTLRGNLEELGVESRSLKRVLDRSDLSPRELAGFPTLLRNPSFNNLLSRLSEREAQRAELLDRRTVRDPDVVILTNNIRQLEEELVTLARAYLDGLNKQQAELQSELQRYQATLAALPEQAEETFRLQREVKRLSETLVALQTQLVQTRLAAIAEGGEVRPIDLATPPEEPEFPKPLLNLAIGLFGGLVLGSVGALGRAYVGEQVESPRAAEVAAGVPVMVLDPHSPLLLRGDTERRSVLIIPVGSDVHTAAVAHRLAETAALQGGEVILVQLDSESFSTRPSSNGSGTPGQAVVRRPAAGKVLDAAANKASNNGYAVYRWDEHGTSDLHEVRRTVEDLERRFSLVVVALPGLQHSATAALLSNSRSVVLVGRTGRVTTTELKETVSALSRTGVATAAVILQNGNNGSSRRS